VAVAYVAASITGRCKRVNETGFTRRLRLTSPADFQRVFQQQACKSTSLEFTVLAVANQQAYPRLGLAIAKKHVRRAVDRNRIKRLIRESFRHNQALLSGLDIVVLARKGVDNSTNETINSALNKHWKVLNQRCKES
jgi:ribonuclease P protein component